ncbi:DUF202 domain-containing protein [Psychroserpens burtonensis]|uniref:DUF202 domain-containing protein n=1 Tax=Psychroserpens burtonensis TaxID=49278 RepID=UPI00040D24D5|nr:DUF202 domain-containing protein [Psychroserpens burtonensis]
MQITKSSIQYLSLAPIIEVFLTLLNGHNRIWSIKIYIYKRKRYKMKQKSKKKGIKLLKFGRDFEPDERVILRDYLAIERTRLANERTLLSYIRSSLYLLLGAIAFFQLKDFTNFKYLALTALVFSALFFIIGIYRFLLLKRSLKRVYYRSEEMTKDKD